MSNNPGLEESVFNGQLGQRIEAKRRQRGITQLDLADRLDVHRNTLSRWESGGQITLWDFLRVCDGLEIQPQKLLPIRNVVLAALRKQVVSERDPALSSEERRKYGLSA